MVRIDNESGLSVFCMDKQFRFHSAPAEMQGFRNADDTKTGWKDGDV